MSNNEPHPITHAQGLLEGVLRSLDKVDEINKEGLKRVLVEVVGLLNEVQEKPSAIGVVTFDPNIHNAFNIG